MSEATPDAASKPVQAGVFLACLLAVGVPFWRIPYSSVNVPDAFYGAGLLVVAIAPLVLVRFAGAGFARSLLIPALAPAAALLLRVIVEGIQDPSRHNLWPLALVIVLVLGVVVAVPGAVVGRLMARVWS